jgi:hypothetical protein
LFNCPTKFQRKVDRLIATLGSYTLLIIDDHRGHLASLAQRDARAVIVEKVSSVETSRCTHAIIVDDGKTFPEEERKLASMNAKIRRVHVCITRVINIKSRTDVPSGDTAEYAYIGRGSYWGNPYPIGEDGDTREDVINKFKFDFERDIFPTKRKEKVFELMGKTLGCFCKPEACHGDVLADFLNAFDDGR